MNTIARNKRMWGDFGWESRGEHWSLGWGGSDAHWHFCTRPRIARFIPCESIVEIATGYGRWTKYLVNEAQRFWGFDLVEKCAAHCRETYGSERRLFQANDGLHLTGVAARSVDFVLSMVSLVHVDWPTLRSYLAETLRILKPGGAAMLHHSNAAAVPGFATLEPAKRKSFRAADVSAEMVRKKVGRHGGGVLAQEIVDWGGSGPDALIDCFSTIVTHPVETAIVQSPDFMADMRRIAKVAPLYHASS